MASTALATPSQPVVEWEKYYNNAYAYDAISFIVQSSDGGYVLLAPNNHYSLLSYLTASAVLLKIDKSGDVEWERHFNESGSYDFAAVGGLAQTSDGGYVFAHGGTSTVELVKVDSAGNTVWNYSFPHYGYGISMAQTIDGGFVIAGAEDGIHDVSSLWLVKTNCNGELLWTKTVGNQLASLSHIIQSKDGNLLAVGYVYNVSAPVVTSDNADLVLLKISSTGSLLWSKTYDQGKSAWGDKAIVQTSDGGYILTDNAGAATVIKTDSNGNLQWTRTYNVTRSHPSSGSTSASLNSVILTSDGGLAFAGTSNYLEAWLLKTDAEGNVEWNQTYGDRDQYGYQAYSLLEASDGSLLVGGEWQQMSHLVYYYLLKTQPILPIPTAPPESPVTPAPQESEYLMQIALPITIAIALSLSVVLITLVKKRRDLRNKAGAI